jgi:hypothetical protein
LWEGYFGTNILVVRIHVDFVSIGHSGFVP